MAIALYLRLSEADGDLGIDGKNESNSIENQRMLLHQYVEAREWEDEIVEYVDDGYTGTNFNRPGFKAMIEGAKRGEISTILVKDLSRLGRDYIIIGDYIEQIFPILKVRFIAINNGFDSENHSDPNMSFDMAVSNLINTFYSRDLSKKIRSANRVRWKQGINHGAKPPYGYKKDPNQKGKFVIDPEAAEVVRKIFDLALEGKNTSQIAYALNENKIPVPSVYSKLHNYPQKFNVLVADHERLWDTSKIGTILNRYEYTGALVMGKQVGLNIGSTHRKTQPMEKRVIVENTHEAIVSKDEFEQASLVIKQRKNPEFCVVYKYPLKGKIRCGNCRLQMSFNSNAGTDILRCSHAAVVGKHSECFKGRYSMKRIESIVLYSIKQMLDTMQWLGDKGEKKTRKKLEIQKKKVRDISKEIETLKQDKIRQYTKYVDGFITKEVYVKIKDELNNRIDNLEIEKKEKDAQVIEDDKLREEAVEMINLSGKYAGTEKLTREMAEAFIDCVYLYDPEHVEIVFTFEDSIEKLMDVIKEKDNDD